MKNKKVPHHWGTPGTIIMFWVETRGKVWLLLTNRRLYCPMLLVACVHAQPRNQVGYPGESTKVENSGESEPSSSSQPSSEQNLRTSRSLRHRSSRWGGLIVGRIKTFLLNSPSIIRSRPHGGVFRNVWFVSLSQTCYSSRNFSTWFSRRPSFQLPFRENLWENISRYHRSNSYQTWVLKRRSKHPPLYIVRSVFNLVSNLENFFQKYFMWTYKSS